MRHLMRPFCSAAALLSLAACASQGAAPPRTSPPSAFPLTITRTGGIAGFQDVLVITSDGLVSITQKGKEQRQCRLTPEAAKRVTTAASKVPWPRLTPGSTSAAFPDDLVTTVLSPSGGPVRLEDPQVAAVGPVLNELVNDVSSGRAGSGLCTPV